MQVAAHSLESRHRDSQCTRQPTQTMCYGLSKRESRVMQISSLEHLLLEFNKLALTCNRRRDGIHCQLCVAQLHFRACVHFFHRFAA